MLNTECKQCHRKWHHTNAKYCSMCGKKFVDEPEFKVGDYVVDDSSYLTMKVDGASNSVVDSAICYNFRYFTVRNNLVCETGYLRHATSEEIAEYESALTFHKHGRKPFEVKQGDILSDSESEKLFVNYEDIEIGFWDKEDFTSGDYTFVKTAEEVNEWLENK